jgi:hypothetical protein
MSSNNVVFVMKQIKKWHVLAWVEYHVFYSGCADDIPIEPNYADKYYKKFTDRSNALVYAHDVVNEIDVECAEEGFPGVEYGVWEI